MQTLGGDLELADVNLIEAVRHFARWQDGGMLVEEDGVLLVSGATSSPVGFSNCTLRVDPSVPAATLLERADEFFSEQGRDYTLWVRDHVDLDVAEVAEARGFSVVSRSPWMLHRGLIPESVPDGAELRMATSLAEVRHAQAVNREAYQALAFPAEEVDAIYGRATRVLGPQSHIVVAYLAGQPVATAMSIVTAGTSGIYWVGTVDSARRRGLAAACTARAGNLGLRAGARVAVLQASPLGEPVYRALGFGTVSHHRWYLARSRR